MPELADRDSVREYYGKILKNNQDLKTSACCTADGFPEEHRQILDQIHPEILDKFYGCGSPIPDLLDGKVVLDLGCGTGRDVYLASRLVGANGRVFGVDMTEEQLAVAEKHAPGQAERFGYESSNVDFHQGFIEDLAAAGIGDESVDVVISNCVINLSPDKKKVFSEIFRVLKPGGELLFSDVFAGRRVPRHLREDPVLHGECLGGAMYMEDFRRLLLETGIRDYRVLKSSRITLNNGELEARAGGIDFYSRTVRVFKLSSLEDVCEDYGQTATYLGTIPYQPHYFKLDDHHRFTTGKPMMVCGNTADMISKTRYGSHFRVDGDRVTHFGPFDCSPAANDRDNSSTEGACC
jgi:arsenite methyltransferase